MLAAVVQGLASRVGPSSGTGRLVYALCLMAPEGSIWWHQAVLLDLAKGLVSILSIVHCWCDASGVE